MGPALCLPPHSMGSLFRPGPLEELSVRLHECSGPSVAPEGRKKDGWMDGRMERWMDGWRWMWKEVGDEGNLVELGMRS